ncbi:Mitogen-activated protein kinase kinase kinase [Monoraphidium neglectum]|uniref:Mitogen-activated protein kinase kinase kinase n=1 Tax=Monoraphidium neglectum TaxID=145388 RepID=A0A0D2MBF7_9CHLO|nr:Mitogen-activated protein kinase kinase kinase [Monoraphidium neglectum]KIY92650.1 Mitogen-activated protein kinase kinase kinase [Monoraphidium neglectum]|eukprot:XP_013891670.1 Mitogen-activated protein kinase kinase kinase [Monoraphidium neglectum]
MEALLSASLSHPNIVRTLKWASVHGEDRLEQPRLLLGETLPPPDNPALTRIQELRAQAQALAKARQEGPPQQTQSRQQQQQQQEQQQQEQKQERERRRRQEKEEEQQQQQQREQQRWEQQYRASEVVVLDDAVPCGGAAGEAVGGGPGGACQDPQTWMVLEYCDRGCLQDAIDQGWLRDSPSFKTGRPNTLAVLATAREIASGMAYLHSQNVIHGDLSAFNVMLSSAAPGAALCGRGFVAKVADFGLSRVLDCGSKIQTSTYGTMTAMAPEVLSQGVISKQADVYSWGVLLWQM